MSANTSVGIIGAGYASLAAAAYMAKAGYDVSIYEKNDSIGGRSRSFTEEGFTFDMGPSWYWMPDVFERFFSDFGKSTSDYYELVRTDPSYRVYFDGGAHFNMPTTVEGLCELFESEEQGAGKKLEQFLKEAEHNYKVAIEDLVYRPGVSPLELVTAQTVRKLGLFVKTISKDVRARFQSERLRSILEFPVLFLGAKPSKTPAFYNFMNYADMVLGTWYPMGGMFKVVEAMASLCEELGVKIHTSSGVDGIEVEQGRVKALKIGGQVFQHDILISGADYAHTEQLLPDASRRYSDKYWESRTFAPSSLLFYLGLDKRFEGVKHHMLFFDTSFEVHAQAIYDNPKWPERPLFYANFPSRTDDSLAPEGCESCFLLIPLAPGLEDTPALREQYFDELMDRFRDVAGEDIREHIIYKRSYCVKDFVSDYNSYKGNAYGLANTLTQTAFMRPSIKSSKVEGLYFTGQLTVPGPGVPPSLISGKIVADMIVKKNQRKSSYAATL